MIYMLSIYPDSMGHENMNYMPIKDIMQFENA